MSGLTWERALSRDRWIVGACIAVICLLAWTWLWREGASMGGGAMAGMDMPGMDMGGAGTCLLYTSDAADE